MKTYFLKLLPPRPTFAQDMTPAEAKLMQAHGAYWSGLMAQGIAVVFGVVGDPQVPYGVGIIELADEADPKEPACPELPTNCRESDPTSKMSNGWPACTAASPFTFSR